MITLRPNARQRPSPHGDSAARQLSPTSRQLSRPFQQLSPFSFSLALAAILVLCANGVSACNPQNNCNAEGYCCCSRSVFYSARPVGRHCEKHFRGYMLAAILVPALVAIAVCLGLSYLRRRRFARPPPNSYPANAEAGTVPAPYIAGPGAYMGGPGRYSPGPGAYPEPPMPYQGAPGPYQNPQGPYVGGPGAYMSGPGVQQGDPRMYQGGLLSGSQSPAYGVPVPAYPAAAHLPEDRYKQPPAPYR